MLHLAEFIDGILKAEAPPPQSDPPSASPGEKAPRPFGVARRWPEIPESDLRAPVDEREG